MVSRLFLVFLNWGKTFHVHVDSFGIALGNILMQLGKGIIDHIVYFSSRNTSQLECNYSTIEHEGL